MVRAYQLQTDQKAFWCENCDEWISDYYTRFVVDTDQASYWDFNGTSYYDEDDVARHEMYFCDSCSEPISLGKEPEMQKIGAWVCGQCKKHYDDQEEARECCD